MKQLGIMSSYLSYSLKLLSSRSYTKKEMMDKLLKKGANIEETEQILTKLMEWKYINDEDYSTSWIQQKIRTRACGQKIIKLELLQKGISKEHIAKKINELFPLEIETAIGFYVAEKYYNIKVKRFEKEKILPKMYAHLTRKGFPSEIINQVMTKYQ